MWIAISGESEFCKQTNEGHSKIILQWCCTIKSRILWPATAVRSDATTRHEAWSPWHVTRQTSQVIRNGGTRNTPFFIVCQRPLEWTAWGAARHAEAVGQGAAFGHNAIVVEGWAQGGQRLGVGGCGLRVGALRIGVRIFVREECRCTC